MYAAVARLDDDPEEFSVVLRFLGGNACENGQAHDAEVRLLAPDLLPEISQRLVSGSHMTLMEGSRVVADCEIVSTRQESVIAR
jgi:hypothetical protein